MVDQPCHTRARDWPGIPFDEVEIKAMAIHKRGKTLRMAEEKGSRRAYRIPIPFDGTFYLRFTVSGEVVRLPVMGGNQSVPKITARDRAILEYDRVGSF